MPTIFYGICGEGRGHATRSLAMIDSLRNDNTVVVYTSGHAFDFFSRMFRDTDVSIRRIRGITFHYDRKQRLDYARTGIMALRYLVELPHNVRRLRDDIQRDAPDLVITDFEPALPRAAEREHVPYISIDHQHLFVTSDLSGLPFDLQCHAVAVEAVARAYYRRQARAVVASFFYPPERPGARLNERVGLLLRSSVANAVTESRSHVLVYLRRGVGRNVLDELLASGVELRVYGLGPLPAQGAVSFHAIDPTRFVEDIATCRALVGTAGNQLISEALFLGKPILALPEGANQEQRINAYFLQSAGFGAAVSLDDLTARHITGFVDRSDTYAKADKRWGLLGNEAALEVVRNLLPVPAFAGRRLQLPRRIAPQMPA